MLCFSHKIHLNSGGDIKTKPPPSGDDKNTRGNPAATPKQPLDDKTNYIRNTCIVKAIKNRRPREPVTAG